MHLSTASLKIIYMNELVSRSHRLVVGNFNSVRALGLKYLPGICFCLLVVLAANYLADHYGGTPVLGAILLGMAFNTISRYGEFAAGLDFCASWLMRAGVALLGTNIAFGQIIQMGIRPLIVVIAGVGATLLFSLLAGRLLKFAPKKSLVSGAAVAICGASAAMAVASVLPRNRESEQHLLCTLVAVTGFSTLAMMIYPGVLSRLDLTAEQAGLFLGASIHDVAQVLGAGQMMSDEVLHVATFTKMLRVTLLVPVVALFALIYSSPSEGRTVVRIVPGFLIAFVLLSILANLAVIPADYVLQLGELSRFFLLMAMAALGTKTNLVELWNVGRKPFLLLLANTLFIAFVAAAVIFY